VKKTRCYLCAGVLFLKTLVFHSVQPGGSGTPPLSVEKTVTFLSYLPPSYHKIALEVLEESFPERSQEQQQELRKIIDEYRQDKSPTEKNQDIQLNIEPSNIVTQKAPASLFAKISQLFSMCSKRGK